LVNLPRDQWRREAVRRRHKWAQSNAAIARATPESAYVARTDVWRAFDVLSPRRRAILVMYELDGMSATAIASLLGISTVTVRWHLSRGRRELARLLDTHAGAEDEHAAKPVTGWRSASARHPGA
jgi:RNA polymerase sigma factor (sigma-70 family)